VELSWSDDPASFASPGWAALAEADPAATPFHTPEYLKLYWEELGGRLLTVVVTEGGEAVAACAFELEDGLLRFLGGTEVTDYQGPVARPAGRDRAAKELLAGLAGLAARDDWREADLRGLPEDSPWLGTLAMAAPDAGLVAEVVEDDVAPWLDLPGSFDEYLAGLRGKLRHEIRRKGRRLEEAFPGARLVDATPESLREDLDLFLTWHRASPGQKSRFMRPGMELFFRRLAEGLLPEGRLRLVFLDHGGRRLAGVLAFPWRDRLLLYNAAFDRELGALAPGMVLIAGLIRDLIRSGVRALDMLKGDLDYKYRFGARPRSVQRVAVRRP
jgi:CelD/BcsL family acetyltransferase involved in cellulose biosynthesis